MATLAQKVFPWGNRLYNHDAFSPHCITENLERINKKITLLIITSSKLCQHLEVIASGGWSQLGKANCAHLFLLHVQRHSDLTLAA